VHRGGPTHPTEYNIGWLYNEAFVSHWIVEDEHKDKIVNFTSSSLAGHRDQKAIRIIVVPVPTDAAIPASYRHVLYGATFPNPLTGPSTSPNATDRCEVYLDNHLNDVIVAGKNGVLDSRVDDTLDVRRQVHPLDPWRHADGSRPAWVVFPGADSQLDSKVMGDDELAEIAFPASDPTSSSIIYLLRQNDIREQILNSIGHEAGHALHMEHYYVTGMPDGYPTLMLGDTKVYPAARTYGKSDLEQMRLFE
jgi:hypothetical protein